MLRLNRLGLILLLLISAPLDGGAAPGTETRDGVAELEETLHQASEKAAPFIVSIMVDRAGEDPDIKIARAFSLFAQRPIAPITGTVIDPDGYIITSYFNVSGEINGIKATLPDGRKLAAERIGYSKKFDLALLKVDARKLPVPEKVSTATLRVGQMVLACGRPTDGRNPTANSGIISAFNRGDGLFTQVDARLNFGNVGGPLLDMNGRLIGVTCNVSTSRADWWGQNSGVSFAVNWEKIEKILPRLKEGLAEGWPAYLGVTPSSDKDDLKVRIFKDTPAEIAGMKDGDVVLEFDGKKVENFDALREAIDSRSAGDRVRIKIRRKSKTMELKVKLGERPQ